jgi:lysophospholipase L1-like esterase
MHCKTKLAIVPFCVVVLSWMSAGVASAQTKKLACVGDSITALPSSWCGELGKKMPGWTVQNFGVSGTNAAKSVGQPYWSSAQYKPSHDFLPNLVVIMLGTNDGVPRVWQAGKSHFVADYEELIDTYETLSSKPRVYAIIPIPAGTGPFGHDPDIIADEIGPAVKMAAMTKNVTTIDGFNAFGGKDFDESLYGTMDQIHPNAKGQGILADAVYKVLDATGGLTGMPIVPTAGDGGVSGMAAADAGAGGVTGAIGGSGGTAAADGGAGRASPGGAADGGAPADAGRSTGSKPATDGSTSGTRASDSGAPSSDGDEGDDDDEMTDSNAPPVSKPESRDAGGCQATGSSASNHGLIALLLLLLSLALRSRIVRGTRGR